MWRATAVFLMLAWWVFPGRCQDLDFFHEDEHFAFYSQDEQDYGIYVKAFNDSYDSLCDRLGLKKDHHIRVFIFESQRHFVEHIFGRWEPGITSVGMADAEEQLVLITSFYDGNTGRDLEEYLKVVRHELVHILSPHEKAWLSEGLALFLAGQERDFIEYPEHIEQLELFLEANIYNPEAYGYYSWLTRYIIRQSDFEAYLDFFRSSDNWALIGYPDQGAFCEEAFRVLRDMQHGD